MPYQRCHLYGLVYNFDWDTFQWLTMYWLDGHTDWESRMSYSGSTHSDGHWHPSSSIPWITLFTRDWMAEKDMVLHSNLKMDSVLWDHSTWIGESAGFLVIGHPIKVQIKRVIAIAGFCYLLGQTNPLALLKFAEAITTLFHFLLYMHLRPYHNRVWQIWSVFGNLAKWALPNWAASWCVGGRLPADVGLLESHSG